jgi:hypothetical protein
MLSKLSVLETPAAILTVENYASFNRQVRGIEDGSLVVYTGGFPAAGVIELLSKVLMTVPAEVPFLTPAACASSGTWRKTCPAGRGRT